MPVHEFFFALDLSDEPHFDHMLALLSEAVLRYAGYDSRSAAAITSDLRAALAAGAGGSCRRCAVRFVGRLGMLHISISYAGGQTWETARELPTGS